MDIAAKSVTNGITPTLYISTMWGMRQLLTGFSNIDPEWKWEPFALDQNGLPLFDPIGGLWIKLTILGETKPGYGHPDGKTGGNAVKETIGDALRNAGMRFGLALDLWHKGDLHERPCVEPDKDEPVEVTISSHETAGVNEDLETLKANIKRIGESGTLQQLEEMLKTEFASNCMDRLFDRARDLHDRTQQYIDKVKKHIAERDAFPGVDGTSAKAAE